MLSELVDSCDRLGAVLDEIGDCTGYPPTLYVDLEGNDLSRHGTLSLVTIFVKPQDKVYLIDVTTLSTLAFDAASRTGKTLRLIFEAADVVKVFFDIRNDSDALFERYGIRVQGIEDLQLMELASRSFNRRCVNGLAKCIEKDSTIGQPSRRDWQRVKNEGRRLFDPARGGSFAVFDRRPLPSAIQDYCVQDVIFMPHLRATYLARICDAWWIKIEKETKARIQLSQSSTFNGQGRHMALGPSGWSHWSPAMDDRITRNMIATLEGKRAVGKAPCEVDDGSKAAAMDRSDTLSPALTEGIRMMKVQEDGPLSPPEREEELDKEAVVKGEIKGTD